MGANRLALEPRFVFDAAIATALHDLAEYTRPDVPHSVQPSSGEAFLATANAFDVEKTPQPNERHMVAEPIVMAVDPVGDRALAHLMRTPQSQPIQQRNRIY
jgi:hypothetical protein